MTGRYAYWAAELRRWWRDRTAIFQCHKRVRIPVSLTPDELSDPVVPYDYANRTVSLQPLAWTSGLRYTFPQPENQSHESRRDGLFGCAAPCSDRRRSTEPPLLVFEFGLRGRYNLGRQAELHQLVMDLHPCEVPHACQCRAAAEHGDLGIGFDIYKPERIQ